MATQRRSPPKPVPVLQSKALSRLVSSGSRTRDPSITSRLLYPTELWTITANMGLEPTTSGIRPCSASELDCPASAGSRAAAYAASILRHSAPGRTHEPHPLTARSADEFFCASRPPIREAHFSQCTLTRDEAKLKKWQRAGIGTPATFRALSTVGAWPFVAHPRGIEPRSPTLHDGAFT